MSPGPSSSEWAQQSHLGQILGVTTVLHALSLCFVAARIYTRLRITKSAGADDVVMAAATLCALGGWVCFVCQARFGLGRRHTATLSSDDRIAFDHIGFWQSVISAGAALGLLKLAIALSLMRFAHIITWCRWSLWAIILFVLAFTCEGIIWLFVYCTPLEGYWNPNVGHCQPFSVLLDLTYLNISCNMFTDVALVVLPSLVIWKLKMKRRVRIVLVGLIGLGLLAVVLGVFKAVAMMSAGTNTDKTFNQWVQFWGYLQLNIGIIAHCASTLQPLVSAILQLTCPTQAQYAHQNGLGRGGTIPPPTIGSKRFRRMPSSDTSKHEHELGLECAPDPRRKELDLRPDLEMSKATVISASCPASSGTWESGDDILLADLSGGGILQTRVFTLKESKGPIHANDGNGDSMMTGR